MKINHDFPVPQSGVAKRCDDWDALTCISTVGRATLQTIPNYRLTKAATRAEASPQARLLLVHLITYLPVDKAEDPKTRFVVFPGNERLGDELSYSKRSVQRLAEELENKGLLRRCYNGLNRRTGFDLTPLAMRHQEIEASLVLIQTKRKTARERQQMELSLSADQIERPTVASNLSSHGVNSGIHNRPLDQKTSAVHKLDPILDAVNPDLKNKLCALPKKDRTGGSEALKEALILKHLTGTGRAAHLGWAQAKRTFGFERSLSLLTIAENDPRRKASTDRYFGWLVRTALSGDGHEIIHQAAKRVTKIGTAEDCNFAEIPLPQHPSKYEAGAIGETSSINSFLGLSTTVVERSSPADTINLSDVQPVPSEDRSMMHWRKAIRDQLGSCTYERWIQKVRIRQSRNVVTITAQTPFTARYIADNLGTTILYAIQTAANSQDLRVEYDVAQ